MMATKSHTTNPSVRLAAWRLETARRADLRELGLPERQCHRSPTRLGMLPSRRKGHPAIPGSTAVGDAISGSARLQVPARFRFGLGFRLWRGAREMNPGPIRLERLSAPRPIFDINAATISGVETKQPPRERLP
jgi:hypothetical protein